MANNLLTISMITNEALAVLVNSLQFSKYVNRQYDPSFGKVGAKIGDTLNVRKPPRFIGRTGQASSVEDMVESSVPVKLTTQFGVDLQATSADFELRIDDFSDRFLRPAIAAVANKIDFDGLTLATNATFNSVGTPGTALTDGKQIAAAAAKLDLNACPHDAQLRAGVFGPVTSSNIITGTQSLFNPGNTISEQYKTGNLGIAYGVRNNMSQNVQYRTVGPLGGTPLVNGAGQTGSSLVTNGWTAAAASRLNVGDVFTLAGVYAVNPQNRTTTNQLQQFVVTAAVSSDASGNATIAISPAITPSGQFQNVTASPASGAALTVVGAAGTVTEQNLVYGRDAFTLAMADLPLPGGVDMAARKADSQTGASIRIVRQYSATTDQFITRLDVLYGWAALYPEWSCRIQA